MSLTKLRFITAISCVTGGLICWYLFDSFVDGVGVFGNVVSVFGLVITIDVLVVVRQLQRRYVRQAVLKASVDKLNACRRNLATGIRDKDSDLVRRTLSQIRGILTRLSTHFEKDLILGPSIETIESILKVDNRSLVSRTRDAQADLESKTEELALLLMEHEWGDHNV